jgi:hypothetical protein
MAHAARLECPERGDVLSRAASGLGAAAALDLQGGLRLAIAVESKRHVRSTCADAAARTRFQRRLSPAATELLYMFNGDNNGVCHYLGTSYGQQEFVNPALSGMLQVVLSSWPPSRSCLSGVDCKTCTEVQRTRFQVVHHFSESEGSRSKRRKPLQAFLHTS